MKKAAIIALSIVICLAALFWITIETNPEIATRPANKNQVLISQKFKILYL